MRHYLPNVTLDDLEFIDKYTGNKLSNYENRWLNRYASKVDDIVVYVNKDGWFTYNDKSDHTTVEHYREYVAVNNIEDLIRLDTSPEFYESYLRSVTKLGELL